MTVATRSIRHLDAGDVLVLQTIDHRAHGESWSRRIFIDEIEQTNRVHLVAHVRGSVVGHAAAWIDGSSCRITNVAVDHRHTGHGHASALLTALLRSVLATYRISNLQLEVRPQNRRAQRLYRQFGFSPVGIDKDYYDRVDQQGSRDALVMAVTDVCDDAWRALLDDRPAAVIDPTNAEVRV